MMLDIDLSRNRNCLKFKWYFLILHTFDRFVAQIPI